MTSIRIKDLCKRLSLNTEKRVVKYALEIARRASSKCRNLGGVRSLVSDTRKNSREKRRKRKQGVVCVDAISVELACQVCKYALTEDKRKTLIKRSGQNRNVYQQTLVKIRTSLGIKIEVSMRTVALKFGLQSLLPFANVILSQYKKRTREQIGAIQSQFLKFDNPSFEAAALSLAASKRKVRVDAERLVNAVGTTIIEFRRIRNSMLETCMDLVSTATTTKSSVVKKSTTKTIQKKRKRSLTKTFEEEKPEEVIPGYENTKEASEARAKAAEEQANREYLEWKRSVTSDKKKHQKKKRKKQTSIVAAFNQEVQGGGSTKETENSPNDSNTGEEHAFKKKKNGSTNDLDSLLAASFS